MKLHLTSTENKVTCHMGSHSVTCYHEFSELSTPPVYNATLEILDSTFFFISELQTFPFRLHILVGLHA